MENTSLSFFTVCEERNSLNSLKDVGFFAGLCMSGFAVNEREKYVEGKQNLKQCILHWVPRVVSPMIILIFCRFQYSRSRFYENLTYCLTFVITGQQFLGLKRDCLGGERETDFLVASLGSLCVRLAALDWTLCLKG